jgi:hypothetical protein
VVLRSAGPPFHCRPRINASLMVSVRAGTSTGPAPVPIHAVATCAGRRTGRSAQRAATPPHRD